MSTTPTRTRPRRPAERSSGDKPLRRDVRMLGMELGTVLRRYGDEGLFETIELIRRLAKARRAGDADADRRLHETIRSLSPRRLADVVRALSCFFDLSNLAEDRHRVRVLRHRERELHPAPQSNSIGAAVNALRERGLSADEVQALLDRTAIELVFTAHPTEAKRRTVRNALRRLRRDLIDLDRRDLVPRERRRLVRRIQTDLASLWETDPIRPRRPTVIEEVRRGRYVAEELWDVVPAIYRTFRLALQRAYPGHDLRPGTFLRFGSWIGGDRDGNPYVTTDVTARTLAMFHEAAVEKHIGECRRLTTILSISDKRHRMSDALVDALADARRRWPEVEGRIEPISPHEVYRQWLRVIRFRLERTHRVTLDGPTPEAAYREPDELRRDIELIAESLRANDHHDLADGEVREWIDRVRVFGFHLAALDVREDSRRLHEAVAQLAQHMEIESDYERLDEAGRQALLSGSIAPDAAARLDDAQLSEEARETLGLFDLLHRAAKTYGRSALGMLVVSMTHRPSDVLPMLWLSRLAAVRTGGGTGGGSGGGGEGERAITLPIVPLFETIDDLDRAGDVLEELLDSEPYAEHLAASGGTQVCMIGYSDSTKDGGYLAANWRQYQGQRRLAETAERRGVDLMLFHGRGGSLGRGGGPAARSILSLPPATVRGRIRITEQGEVLAERYDDPAIAYRHLEQVTWATMLVSATEPQPADPAAQRLIEEAAQRSMRAYRALIEDPAFVEYFSEATPIDAIETLPIGSRPSRRGGQRSLGDLRAIPYTFAWTQNRHMITAFFGLGAGLGPAAEEDPELLRRMYADWPFFRGVIDNAELALAKCDIGIAREYAALMEDRGAADRIWSMIESEYQRARRVVLAITGRDELLAGTPWLKRSIEVRNPYVDPLNLIQMELMRRSRDVPEEADAEPLDELLRLTIQGIAAGMRTTG